MSKLRRTPLISLCMIVKNEAETLDHCLQSVRGVAGELIIVDTGSTDDTIQIARRHGAEIIHFTWTGDFAAARNAGLKRARGTWILVLDADEELDAGSKGELLVCAEHLEYEAFFVRIHNHKSTLRSSPAITVNPILRMFRNRAPYRFTGIVHEQIAAAIVEARPAAAMHMSTVVVHHYGYADGVVAKKDKIRRNVGLLQEQLRLNPHDAFHHFNMAVEYMRLGEYEPALRHIQSSLEEAPPDTSYVHLLYKYEIRCRAMLGDAGGALDACIRGIALFPDYADLYHLQGLLLMQTGDFALARQPLRHALEIGVSPPVYHTESGLGTYLTLAVLAQLCQETGEVNETIACYTRAAQLHPEPWPVIARLVRSLKCARREHEMIGWLKDHLPQVAAGETILRLLLQEGCFAAAAELLGGGGLAAGRDTERSEGPRGAGGANRRGERDAAPASGAEGAGPAGTAAGDLPHGGELREAGANPLLGQRDAAPASSAESTNRFRTAAGDHAAALKQLLLQLDAAPAGRLEHEAVAQLLRHPAAQPGDNEAAAERQGAAASRSWLLLADRMLASLPPSAGSAPAADRARLMLPLPRIAE